MSTLSVAFEDFILSREAALCSHETIDFYRRMLKPFLAQANGSPPTNRMVREFLATVAQRGVSSATVGIAHGDCSTARMIGIYGITEAEVLIDQWPPEVVWRSSN